MWQWFCSAKLCKLTRTKQISVLLPIIRVFAKSTSKTNFSLSKKSSVLCQIITSMHRTQAVWTTTDNLKLQPVFIIVAFSSLYCITLSPSLIQLQTSERRSLKTFTWKNIHWRSLDDVHLVIRVDWSQLDCETFFFFYWFSDKVVKNPFVFVFPKCKFLLYITWNHFPSRFTLQ